MDLNTQTLPCHTNKNLNLNMFLVSESGYQNGLFFKSLCDWTNAVGIGIPGGLVIKLSECYIVDKLLCHFNGDGV